MKTMMLTGIRRMEMQEVPTPAVAGDRDVLVRMGAVGVCGSDVHYYQRGKIGTQVVTYPFAVGHECAGVVEAVGAGVTGITPGQRVAIDPAITCGACDQCRVGRPHTCRHLRYLACPGQVQGCLSEFILMPEANCVPIQDAMTLEQAALSEPLSIGVYAVKLAALPAGAKVGILGAGPIGLSVLLPAKVAGAAVVYMTDKIDARLDVAGRAGADWIGNPDSGHVAQRVHALEPAQLDVVFECCGDQAALDQAVELLRPGGKLMIVGIPPDNTITFDINALRHKEIGVQTVRRQNGCVQRALDLIDTGGVDVDFMVTHRFPFDRVQDAFDLVADYRDGVVKAMIHLD